MVRPKPADRARQRLAREIRNELITLPLYGVFDNLTFRLENGKLTLLGQVSRPTLKTDAEEAVKEVEGVEAVDNQIEVLPVSPQDDRIRLAAYRAIYSQPQLQRYALQAIPPVHIVVKNGNLTLEGAVLNDGDRSVANVAARGVPGVLNVANNLRTDKEAGLSP